MKMVQVSICCLLLFIFSYGVSSAQDVELFGVARNACVTDEPFGSSLYRVNPDTADAVLVGDIGFGGVTGLAFLPDGKLVGSARDIEGNDFAILINVNPENGAGSLIGYITGQEAPTCDRAPGLSVDPLTNILYATGNQCTANDQYLQTIDPITGLGTLIGAYSTDFTAGNGLAISDTGVFFVTIEQDDIARLITVDPETGAPTFIANLTLNVNVRVNALAFHPITGELYGSTVDLNNPPNERESKLVRINTSTGLTTIVGDLPDCFDGIVFRLIPPRSIPTLSEWGLITMATVIGVAGIALMAIRRRKSAA